MILRFVVIIGFVVSIIAAGGSFSIYSSYQTERQQRLDAESKLMQAQDAATAAKTELDQQKTHVTDLEAQLEALKKSEADLKAQQDAKSSELEKLKKDIAAKDEELADLKAQVENYRKKEMAAPVMKTPDVVVTSQPISTNTDATATATSAASAWGVQTSVPAGSSSSTTTTTATVKSPVAAVSVPVATPAVTTPPVSSASTAASQKPAPLALAPDAPAPAEDSRILTVNRKFNFIVINIGTRDGLKMGDKVQVMQGSAQKALAQVEKIYDKFSAATLLDEDKANPVHEGDTVRRA